MARTAPLLLVLALLTGTLTALPARAQTTDVPSAANAETAATENTPEPEFFKTFPNPPDQPASLLAPAPPLGPPPPNLEQPYFVQDPLLDPPALGAIGWFADVDVGILKPHLVNEISNPVTFPDGNSYNVGVNASHLNWTVSPTIEVGYRFPAGFGGIALSYRNMTSQGSQGVIGADGPATLSSLLNVNVGSLDWISNEYTPWRVCEMRLRFGLRYINDYFSSSANEPSAEAAAGTTIYHQRTTNSNWGVGPHLGVDLRRQLGFGGLSLNGFLDMSEGWGRVRQTYSASSTNGQPPGDASAPSSAAPVAVSPTVLPVGVPQGGGFSQGTSDAIPVLTARLGLNWQPSAYPTLRFFAGGQLDYWWNTGRMGNLTTFGYFFDSGILLRGEWNF